MTVEGSGGSGSRKPKPSFIQKVLGLKSKAVGGQIDATSDQGQTPKEVPKVPEGTPKLTSDHDRRSPEELDQLAKDQLTSEVLHEAQEIIDSS